MKKKSQGIYNNLSTEPLVIIWNQKTLLLDQNGNKYIFTSKGENNGTLYKKKQKQNQNNYDDYVKYVMEPIDRNIIYLAQLDQEKNKKYNQSSYYYWRWNDNNDSENVDTIAFKKMDEEHHEKYFGIFVQFNSNYKKDGFCWKKLCNHTFVYDNIKTLFLRTKFKKCPACKYETDKKRTKNNVVMKNQEKNNNNHDDDEEDDEEEILEASRNGNLEKVRFLVEQKNVDVNIQNRFGFTPLMYASYQGYMQMVQYLVEHGGANINKKNVDHYTALMYAIRQRHSNIVQYLMQQQGTAI